MCVFEDITKRLRSNWPQKHPKIQKRKKTLFLTSQFQFLVKPHEFL